MIRGISMAFETWQIIWGMIIFLVVFYLIVTWLHKRKFHQEQICGSAIYRASQVKMDVSLAKKQFQEPLSKIKFGDLNKKLQKQILEITHGELQLKAVWSEEQDLAFILLTLYEAAKQYYNEKAANQIYALMEKLSNK